jgi:acetylornithine/succinyldiaminopimelate/putrescine aminotransferase
MLEPVQAEGGVYPAGEDYLKQVASFCKENGLLLIMDEIQCGMGRCGTMFAFEQYGVKPDIVTVAKALGGGLPMGAVLAKEEIAKSFGHGTHGTTFGANPVAAAAAAAVFAVIEKEDLLPHVKALGAYFKERLKELQAAFPALVTDVRGKGLLLGLETPGNARAVVDECLKNGVLLLLAGADVVRFLPPFLITENEVDTVIGAVKKALERL